MMHRLKLLSLTFAWLAIGSSSFAQNPVPQSKTTVQKAAREKQESPFSFGASYLFASDQNQITSKKSSRHTLGVSAGYAFNKNWNTGVGTNVLWSAEGNNVQKKEDNPRTEDLELSLDYTPNMAPDWKSALAVTDALPTGYESRTEGVRNTIGAMGSLTRLFFNKKFSLFASGSANFIAQTYDYSITSGESNPDSLYTGRLGASYKLYDGLSVNVSYSLWTFHFINGENNLARNQTSVGAKYKLVNFSVFTSYSVGNYDKSDGYKFLYVDDMRQMVSIGVSFEI